MADLKNTDESSWPWRGLSTLLTEIKKIYELVGELLEVDHDLLLLLENMVVLLWDVQSVNEVRVFFIRELQC